MFAFCAFYFGPTLYAFFNGHADRVSPENKASVVEESKSLGWSIGRLLGEAAKSIFQNNPQQPVPVYSAPTPRTSDNILCRNYNQQTGQYEYTANPNSSYWQQ